MRLKTANRRRKQAIAKWPVVRYHIRTIVKDTAKAYATYYAYRRYVTSTSYGTPLELEPKSSPFRAKYNPSNRGLEAKFLDDSSPEAQARRFLAKQAKSKA